MAAINTMADLLKYAQKIDEQNLPFVYHEFKNGFILHEDHFDETVELLCTKVIGGIHSTILSTKNYQQIFDYMAENGGIDK